MTKEYECLETGQKWTCLKDMVREVKTTRAKMSNHLSGLIKSIDGKHYKRCFQMQKYANKKIKCLETGEIFDSVASLASSLNVNRGSVTNHLAGRSVSLLGKHYLTMDTVDKSWAELSLDLMMKGFTWSKEKECYVKENLEIYKDKTLVKKNMTSGEILLEIDK